MKEKPVTIIRTIKQLFVNAFSGCFGRVAVIILIGLVYGSVNVLVTVCTQNFFDQLGQNEEKIIINLLVLMLVIMLHYIAMAAQNALMEDSSFKIQKNLSIKLYRKASELEAICFEDQRWLEKIQKAKDGIINGTFFINVCFCIVSYYIPYFILMNVYLSSIRAELSFTMLLVFFPVLFSQIIRMRSYTAYSDQSAHYNRQFHHYEECIKGKKFYRETRLLGAGSFFLKLYQESLRIYDQEKWKTVRKSGLAELSAKLITLLGYLAILLFYVWEFFKGFITLGTFAALFTSIHTMFAVMEQLICSHIGRLSEEIGSVKNYVSFITEPVTEKYEENLLTEESEIELEHVYFRYPNQEEYTLKDINLKLKVGQCTALVGENGAGKSTLVKIICGLYKPDRGIIKIDGKRIQSGSEKALMKEVSAVFQNYGKYEMSVKDNIIISNSTQEKCKKQINACLQKVGFSDAFLDETDLILSRRFGGIELSGGQWQRLAIARSMYRKGKILLLDEPTAAIDPLEENQLYHLFQEISKGKLTILVTHKMGAIRMANQVVVLENGCMIEMGNHQQLIKQNGKYAQLFSAQSELYR